MTTVTAKNSMSSVDTDRAIEQDTITSTRMSNGLNNKKVLVTGGAGYIGSVLTSRLTKLGCSVRVLDNFSLENSHIQCLWNQSRVEVYTGDIRNLASCIQATRGVDAVVHLAGIVGDPACEADRECSWSINVEGTRNVFSACRENRVKQMVFASSCSVYGAASDIVNERSETNPLSWYAETKLESERDLLNAHDEICAVTVLRLSTVFGYSPRQRFDLVANAFIAQAMLEKLLELHGGSQRRPFVHVWDVAAMVEAVLSSQPILVSGQIFNAGSESNVLTISELADLVQRIALELGVNPVIARNTAIDDKRDYAVSFSKIEDMLRCRATRTVEDGIKELGLLLRRGFFGDFRHPLYSNIKLLKRSFENPTCERSFGHIQNTDSNTEVRL